MQGLLNFPWHTVFPGVVSICGMMLYSTVIQTCYESVKTEQYAYSVRQTGAIAGPTFGLKVWASSHDNSTIVT